MCGLGKMFCGLWGFGRGGVCEVWWVGENVDDVGEVELGWG